jgi:hypothetical protein
LQIALWPFILHSFVLSLLSYERLSKKPLLFKSFTGLTIKEFDDIYNKEIIKRYYKHEIKRLSKRKDREIGAGRPFKLDVRIPISNATCLLSPLHYLHVDWLPLWFGSKQHLQMYTKDRILNMVRQCVPVPQKVHNLTKRLKTADEVEQYFPAFMAFVDCTEQQIPRPVDKNKRKIFYSGKKKRHTVKNQIMVNNRGLIIHKLGYKKGRRHDYIYKNIKRTILSSQNKLLLWLI